MAELTRRDALATATALGAVAFAGCVADDDGDDDGVDDESDSDDGDRLNDESPYDDEPREDDNDDNDTEELAEQFAESMAWAESDDWRMVWTQLGTDITGEYRYHGDDFYVRFEGLDGTTEWYLVDDTYYFVDEQSGDCLEFDGGFSTVPGPDETETLDPEEQFNDLDPENITYIEECGTDTIDGDPVTCWEVVAPMADTVQYYLLESGRPRRIESPDLEVVIDFFDWGDTDPISPPDMECESPSGR